MEKLYSIVCPLYTKKLIAFSLFFVLVSLTTLAQIRPFGFVYSENLKGGTALFGNTLMNAVNPNPTVDLTAMNGNSLDGNSIYDNGTSDMQYADIDGNSGDGAGTRNSSSADLILPGGTNTVKLARLYWGGRAATADFDMNAAANQTIKVRKGTSGSYQQFAAAQIDRVYQNTGTSTEFCRYQAYVDITALIQSQGAGTYTVGDGAFSTGIIDDFGNYGAWSIVVVYENPASNFNSVRVYDAFEQVYAGGSVTENTVTLTGLNIPSGSLAAADARLGLMGWEGDSRYTGDFFKINGIVFSNALNPADNPWNGTITNNGAHVTTKNPNYTDQFGIDIDESDVGIGYGIQPNDRSITLELGTTSDQFFCGIITFVVKTKDQPAIHLTNTVIDANNSGTAEPGEVLTYKLKGNNISSFNALAVILKDSLPSTVTYVSNSLMVNYGTGITAGLKTDAADSDIAEYDAASNTITFRVGTGADSFSGGSVAPADSFEVQFQVIVNNPGSGTPPAIVNVGRLTSNVSGEFYSDDATAIINPASVLPVTLTFFTAELSPNKQVKLTWNTSMELNSQSFTVERSTNGASFKAVATKPAAGNSSTPLTYFTTDDVSAVTAPFAYYRLLQTDINGRLAASKVVAVRLSKTSGAFNVSPNPFRNTAHISIDWDKNETTVVKVFSVTGTTVVVKSIAMKKGTNYFVLDELAALPSGNYIVEFTTASGKLNRQIIKQK
ncbi:MAG: hypothetical protein JWR61_2867 [Ferruginibacter sp.]|uniref:T9SS type A sorting domain-containing protein n=1 Tax=Ferruginibacter sp. TaxID=1940288 RepID=UPI002658A2E6|nr:T9SS type A sorting domain-containing protein [Ferruginibacter sp.]MDB5277912.1 hypothetical protein [Ferruginibacter sp.]